MVKMTFFGTKECFIGTYLVFYLDGIYHHQTFDCIYHILWLLSWNSLNLEKHLLHTATESGQIPSTLYICVVVAYTRQYNVASFWPNFEAVWSKCYSRLNEFPDKSSNLGHLYERVCVRPICEKMRLWFHCLHLQ